MTPMPVLRQAPIRWQRSAAARMPSGKCSRVCSGPAGGSAGSRRSSVIGAASTITPGVEPPVGVEQRLDLAERLVEVVAEHAPVELAAGAAVAVLGRVDAVELHHQVEDLLGDRAHRLDPARLREVDERADVQAADRAVPVPAGAQPVAVEHLAEGGHVVAQPLGRHRRVLDERQRTPGALAGRHQQPEAGLAHLGQRLLLGRRLGHDRVVGLPLEAVELRARLLGRVREDGHEQQRARVALDRLRQRAVLVLGARQLEDRAVDHLDRRGLERQRGAGGRHRVGDRLEVPDREHARLRQRHQAHLGLGDRHQRALGAGHQPRQVELARQVVEPVAARLAPVLRIGGGDRVGVVAQDRAQLVLERAGLRAQRRAACRRPARRPARTRGRPWCRRRSSGCPTSCCRSSRRSWPGWRSRCRARTRSRASAPRG